MTQQQEALRLAHALGGGKLIDDSTEWADTLHAAAAEPLHQHARIKDMEAQLSAIGAGGVEPLRQQAEDGWIQDGHLLYRLTDGHRPRNRDEINVTMANSSRTEEARTRRASELLHAIRAAAPLGGEEVLAQRIATLAAQTKQAAAAPAVPQGWKPVQIELLERIQESLGSFVSDQGWSQSDMDTADALDELLATTPQPPAAAPAQPGWCDGCSPDNCVGCGPAAPAQVQPEPNREQS